MLTSKEYKESLKQLNTKVYAFGELLSNFSEDPLIRPHVESAAMTYECAHDPRFTDLATVNSHLTGKKVNRFTHIHHSTEDLIKKVKLLRMLGQQTGTCFQRCVGFDALNAVYSTTFDMDEKLGTEYHSRFKKYLQHIQDTDKMVAGSMTDPKGDRNLPPSKQEDPDMYVHVVKKDKDGIIVRGAKAHQTGIVNSHEFLVMPTIALTEEDKDYAVSCAIPVDASGVTHILGRQTNDSRKYDQIDQGNPRYGIVGGEALTILEDVFVPWERVFMCGEHEFSGSMVERFASFHRQNYGGCKTGVMDVMIGATAAAVEQVGVQKASHVRDKITEMVHLSETLYAGSIACSAEGVKLPSNAYYVNTMLANITKQNITRHIYEVSRLSHDLAGGFLATLPSEKDMADDQVGPMISKYLQGSGGAGSEARYRILRLLENMTGGTALVESMHGAGSPQAQRVMIFRQANLKHKKELAYKLCGLTMEGEVNNDT